MFIYTHPILGDKFHPSPKDMIEYFQGYTTYKTRLLGRPQPQMYAQAALSRYTGVNGTHKHFIYIYICFKVHKHFKINFTATFWGRKISQTYFIKYNTQRQKKISIITMDRSCFSAILSPTCKICKQCDIIFYFLNLWWFMGNRMLNPGVPKCDDDGRHIYSKEKQWIIRVPQCDTNYIFGYLGGGGYLGSHLPIYLY